MCGMKFSFFVKYESEMFMLVYKWDIFFFDIKYWIVVKFLLVTEVDAFCFSFWEFEDIFCCSFLSRVGIYFDL